MPGDTFSCGAAHVMCISIIYSENRGTLGLHNWGIFIVLQFFNKLFDLCVNSDKPFTA